MLCFLDAGKAPWRSQGGAGQNKEAAEIGMMSGRRGQKGNVTTDSTQRSGKFWARQAETEWLRRQALSVLINPMGQFPYTFCCVTAKCIRELAAAGGLFCFQGFHRWNNVAKCGQSGPNSLELFCLVLVWLSFLRKQCFVEITDICQWLWNMLGDDVRHLDIIAPQREEHPA